MARGIRKILSLTPATVNSGTEIFSDYTVLEDALLTISIGSNTATAFTLQVTKDGTNYSNGASVPASGTVDLTLAVKTGDIFNIKQTSGTNIAYNWCDVFD